jgi:anti-sigma B factor antagonist
MTLKVFSREMSGVTVLSLQGKLTGEPESAPLTDKFDSLVKENKVKVVVDLSDVRFVNSSGLGTLIKGLSKFRSAHGNLKLAQASEPVIRILQMTKLDGVFEQYQTVEQAVASFAKEK